MLYKFSNFISKIYNYSIALTRKESGSVAMGFAMAIVNYAFQFVLMMGIMMLLRGRFGSAIRAEFGLFVITGVGLFLLHNKLLGELSNAKGNRQLMPVLAVSPGILIFGTILHVVYMQTLIVFLFLAAIWVYYGGFTIQHPVAVLWIYILCIAWSACLAMCFYSIVPVWPGVFSKFVMVYRRIGIVTSGKMVPGNLMMGNFLGLFEWNPLFHMIDQLRGAWFLNYHPRNSNMEFPIEATVFAGAFAILLYVGLRRFR